MGPVGLRDGFLRERNPLDLLRVAGSLGHLAEGEGRARLLHILLLLVAHHLKGEAGQKSRLNRFCSGRGENSFNLFVPLCIDILRQKPTASAPNY